MSQEQQEFVNSLRKHFQGILEATDVFLHNLTSEETKIDALLEEDGEESGPVRALKAELVKWRAEAARWREQAANTQNELYELRLVYLRLSQYNKELSELCQKILVNLKKHDDPSYETYKRSVDGILQAQFNNSLSASRSSNGYADSVDSSDMIKAGSSGAMIYARSDTSAGGAIEAMSAPSDSVGGGGNAGGQQYWGYRPDEDHFGPIFDTPKHSGADRDRETAVYESVDSRPHFPTESEGAFVEKAASEKPRQESAASSNDWQDVNKYSWGSLDEPNSLRAGAKAAASSSAGKDASSSPADSTGARQGSAETTSGSNFVVNQFSEDDLEWTPGNNKSASKKRASRNVSQSWNIDVTPNYGLAGQQQAEALIQAATIADTARTLCSSVAAGFRAGAEPTTPFTEKSSEEHSAITSEQIESSSTEDKGIAVYGPDGGATDEVKEQEQVLASAPADTEILAESAEKAGVVDAVEAEQSEDADKDAATVELEAVFLKPEPRFISPLLEGDPYQRELEDVLNEALADELPLIEDILEQTEADVSLPQLEFLEPEDSDTRYVLSTDEELLESVRKGMTMSKAHEYDAAWELFNNLIQKDSHVLQPIWGLLHNYVLSSCWSEAYKVGIPVLHDTFSTDKWNSYALDMFKAMIHCLSDSVKPRERKRLLFHMAMVHAKYPATARKFLRLAENIKRKIPENSAIYYASLCLGVASDSIDDTIDSLKEITTCPELFDEFFKQAKDPKNRARLPVFQMLETLYLENRAKSKDAENHSRGPIILGPRSLSVSDVEIFSEGEDSSLTLEFMLNNLFPRANLSVLNLPSKFQHIVDESIDIPRGFEPAGMLERLNARSFRFPHMELRYYDKGDRDFFLKATETMQGNLFIFSSEMSKLSSAELQFVILRKCFQLYRHHMNIWHARQLLDDRMMCQLLNTAIDICLETGTDIPIYFINEAKSYDLNDPNLHGRIAGTITRLHRTTNRSEFQMLKEFLFARRPFTSILDGDANRFAAQFVGITDASYGLARLFVGFGEKYDLLEENGFCSLYADIDPKDVYLRRSLQVLWSSYLQNDDFM